MNKYTTDQKAPAPLVPLSYSDLISNWVGEAPVISILCATYQHRDCISRALDGFLAQKTDFPFEVLIRDDASNDGAQEIISRYCSQYPNIIKPIYEEHNQYPRVKPSFLLRKLSRGKYLAFCEGDDYWIDSTKLQKDVELMEANPGNVAVASRVILTRDGVITGCSVGGLRGTACVSRIEIPDDRQEFIHFEDTYQFTILKDHGRFIYREEFTAVNDFNRNGVFKPVLEKDLRKVEYLRSGTKFWLCEYFYERGEFGKAAKQLLTALELQMRAFPHVKAKTLLKELFFRKAKVMIRSSAVASRVLSFVKGIKKRG